MRPRSSSITEVGVAERVRVHRPVMRTVPQAIMFSLACGLAATFGVGGVLESIPNLVRAEESPRIVGAIVGINAMTIAFGASILFLVGPVPKRLLPITYRLVQYALPGLGFVLSLFVHVVYVGLATVCTSVLFAMAASLMLARRHFRELPELQAVGSALHRSLYSPPLVSHATDVHVTKASNVGTVEGNKADGFEAFQAWLSAAVVRGIKLLVVSGDLTDTGDPAEWQRLDAALAEADIAETRLVVAPGNHDLFPYGECSHNQLRLYFEHAGKWCHGLKTCEMQTVCDLTDLANSCIEDRVNTKAMELMEAYVSSRPVRSPHEPDDDEEVERAWRERANTMDWTTPAREMLIREWYRRYWRAAFPLRLDDASGGLILVMNSVLETRLLGESALGELGEAQLARLEAALSALPDHIRLVLIVTHHAPFRAPGDWQLFLPWKHGGLRALVGRLKDFAYLGHASHEARTFLNIVCAAADRHQNVQMVVFCGHRHQHTIGRAGRVLVVEGSAFAEPEPSTTLIYADGTSIFVTKERIVSTS